VERERGEGRGTECKYFDVFQGHEIFNGLEIKTAKTKGTFGGYV
jgi:hypothetical protein